MNRTCCSLGYWQEHAYERGHEQLATAVGRLANRQLSDAWSALIDVTIGEAKAEHQGLVAALIIKKQHTRAGFNAWRDATAALATQRSVVQSFAHAPVRARIAGGYSLTSSVRHEARTTNDQ